MRYSSLLVLACATATFIACAKGEDPSTHPSGSGGQIVGGGTGGMLLGTDGGDTGGAPGTGGASSANCTAGDYTDPTCGACMEASCMSQCNACVSNTECLAWLNCVVGCSDTTCENACTSQHPEGSEVGLAWIGNSGCIGTQCATPCALDGCGLSTNGTYPECDACIESSCCTQGKACANDAECESALTCVQGCTSGDTACEDNCANQYPTGYQKLIDFFDCLSQMCSGKC